MTHIHPAADSETPDLSPPRGTPDLSSLSRTPSLRSLRRRLGSLPGLPGTPDLSPPPRVRRRSGSTPHAGIGTPDLRLGEGTGDPRPPRNPRARSIVALVSALLAVPATAQITLPIEAAADNTIYSDVVTFSNGAGERVFAGRTNQTPAGIRRALMRFDVASAVPAGSTVTSVKLTLYMSAANATSPTGSYALHRVTAPWGEGNSNAVSGEGQGVAAQVNDATWLYRFFNPANPLASPAWTTPGGDFVPTPSASIQIPLTLNYYSWNSTPGLVADVQSWLDTPATNFGWIIAGPEAQAQTARRFDSRQNTDPQRRPKLEVTFTLAPGVGACCFTDGSCQVVTQAQCLSQGGTFSGVGTICTPNPCPQPTAACCLPSGNCLLLTPPECAALGGVFQGVGSTCTPNPCSPQIGGCCLPTGFCQVLTQPDCVTAGGTFLGVGSTCAGANCPIILTPFVDEITKPAVAQPATGTSGGAAHYNISATEFKQKLHRDLPQTVVWGYAGTYPGPTIEAFRDQTVTVSWANDLRVLATQLLRTTHYLPVDPCLHGPNMFGSMPRLVTHLHGARVAPQSDGYPEATVNPGQTHTLYTYPNGQLPATMWYHDHALGITRLNVYMGLGAFYLIRDAFENGLGLPAGDFEMPLLVQDRSFNPDGTLRYPAAWQEDFFGDFMLVNGKVWPFMNVKRGKYRLRIVNGCTSRVLTLAFSDGATFHVIGNDLGMLPAPVPVTQLTLSPAERADLIVNFAPYAPGAEVTLVNTAPAPFPGQPGVGLLPNVMKFNVGSATGFTAAIPATLRPLTPLSEASASVTREFALSRMPDACGGIRWAINERMWDDITEFPRLETTEIWSFINRADMTHSMHIHLVRFQVLDRQPFQIVGGQVVPTGPRVPPPPEEAGWKDTVKVHPQEITRVITRFEGWTGLYPYHCHMLEHEDHEMMRQFRAVCYHDCNEDQQYTVADFGCFQTKFVGGDPYADCNADGQLTVADFGCFQTKFVTGCP